MSITKKSKNKQIFIDRVRNDRVRYDRVRNDRGLEMIGSHFFVFSLVFLINSKICIE